jgi:hypothetical protein
MAVHIWIQFLEQIASVFGPVASQVLLFQEEVDAQVCLADDGLVLDCEVADAGKHEVLERFDANNTRPRVDQKDVRILERDLSGSSPEAQLAVVPALVSSGSWCL